MSEYINKYIATNIPVLPKEHRKQFASYDDAFETGWNEALSCVNIVPTADVVEVGKAYPREEFEKYGLSEWKDKDGRWVMIERKDDDVKQESVFDQENGSNDGMGDH